MTPARPRTALVRPHVVTGGRAHTRHVYDLATLVTAAAQAPTALPHGANQEQMQIMTLCRSGVLSVADIASHLGLGVGFTKIIVDDLVDSGHITTLAPPPITTLAPAAPAELPSIELLKDVLHGLRNL